MGLLDKIKNLFLEDEIEEDEVELEEVNKETYKEPKDILPKVMRDTIKEEELDVKFEELKPNKPKKEVVEEVKKVTEELPQRKFSFPIEFEEEIVAPSRVSNKNVLRVEKEKKEVPVTKKVELYPKKEVVTEKPKFKPTPVISPVYGILDKNYKKEEVREKAEETVEMKRPSKKVDFEMVRKKAFGNLSDEIKDNLMCENCELYKEAKRLSALSKDDLLYDMLIDEEEPVQDENVTIEKAYDNYEDFGVAYEPKKTKIEEPVINNTADVVEVEKVVVEEDVVIENLDDKFLDDSFSEEVKEEVPSRESKKKTEAVDDDFFELIDSMYKERIDG